LDYKLAFAESKFDMIEESEPVINENATTPTIIKSMEKILSA